METKDAEGYQNTEAFRYQHIGANHHGDGFHGKVEIVHSESENECRQSGEGNHSPQNEEDTEQNSVLDNYVHIENEALASNRMSTSTSDELVLQLGDITASKSEIHDEQDTIADDNNLLGRSFENEKDTEQCAVPSKNNLDCHRDSEMDTVQNDSIHVNSEDSKLTTLSRTSTSDDVSQGGIKLRDVYKSFRKAGNDRSLLLDLENNPALWNVPEPSNQEDWIEEDDAVNETDSQAISSMTVIRGKEHEATGISVMGNQQELVRTCTELQLKSVVLQLLEGQRNSEGGLHVHNEWPKAITSLASQAAAYIKPDIKPDIKLDTKPDTEPVISWMDPRGYVKIKYVASGQPSQSHVVEGIACGRNVAHKHMKTQIDHPKLLLFKCALELAPQQLSSIKSTLEEEEMLFTQISLRIEEFEPNILLVGKTVSGNVQKWLLEKHISLVFNVKEHLLEKIANCSGATLIQSLEHLMSRKPIIVGQCKLFHVDKYLEEHSQGSHQKPSKPVMIFEGFPKPLSCSVILRGSNVNEPRELKEVVKLAVFAAYHLAAETSFLADEGADLVKFCRHSPLKIALPEKKSKSELSISTVPDSSTSIKDPSTEIKAINQQSKAMDAEFYLQCDLNNQQSRVLSSKNEEFPSPPSDHQSILVSFTSIMKKGHDCKRGFFRRITYYSTFDEPLGRFLKQNILNTAYRCPSCPHGKDEHIDCYTHQQGSLTIFIHKQDSALTGEGGKIWMWYRCLKCQWINDLPPSSQRVAMSNSACNLSFGKFLELNFSSHAAANILLASCGHSVHHDCLRFYGFENMIACFQYAPSNTYSLNLPPSMLKFNYSDHEDWLRKEAEEITKKVETFYDSMSRRLHQIKEQVLKNIEEVDSNLIVDTQNNISELEDLLSTQREGFKIALQNAESSHGAKQPRIDILQLNKIRSRLSRNTTKLENRMQSLLSSSKSSKSGILSFLKEIGFISVRPKQLEENQEFPFDKGNLVVPKVQTVQGINSYESNGKVSERTMAMSYECRPPESNTVDRTLDDQTLATMGTVKESSKIKLSEKSDEHAGATYGEIGSKTNLNESRSGPNAGLSIVNNQDYRAASEGIMIETMNDEGTSFIVSKKLEDGDLQSAGSQESSLIEGWVGAPIANFQGRENAGKELEERESEKNIESSPRSSPSTFSVSVSGQSTGQQGSEESPKVEIEETMISLYDDEPTSIIAYAIVWQQHQKHASRKPDDKKKELEETEGGLFHSLPFGEGSSDHVKTEFTGDSPRGKIHCVVTFYHAKQFESLRERCCLNIEFIRSLCRCKKWGAEGGKSKVFFAKTTDDRFVIKQVTRTELDSFMTFSQAYFKYMIDSLRTMSPTCLAKILGIYQVMVRHVKGGKELRMDLMIMENLLYDRHVTRIYDLKGSLRSRYNADSNKKDAVLLDENMVESFRNFRNMPIFISTKDKRLLQRAVWNDTSFLASVDVMDYSLLVGIDEDNRQLFIGIIDFMRQYTWDKHLETWVKASGILGGAKKTQPTVISPDQYKKRFRNAMTSYFLTFPDEHTDIPGADLPEETSADSPEKVAPAIEANRSIPIDLFAPLEETSASRTDGLIPIADLRKEALVFEVDGFTPTADSDAPLEEDSSASSTDVLIPMVELREEALPFEVDRFTPTADSAAPLEEDSSASSTDVLIPMVLPFEEDRLTPTADSAAPLEEASFSSEVNVLDSPEKVASAIEANRPIPTVELADPLEEASSASRTDGLIPMVDSREAALVFEANRSIRIVESAAPLKEASSASRTDGLIPMVDSQEEALAFEVDGFTPTADSAAPLEEASFSSEVSVLDSPKEAPHSYETSA